LARAFGGQLELEGPKAFAFNLHIVHFRPRTQSPETAFHASQLTLPALGDQEVFPQRTLILASREWAKVSYGHVAHAQVMEIGFAVPGDLVA